MSQTHQRIEHPPRNAFRVRMSTTHYRFEVRIVGRPLALTVTILDAGLIGSSAFVADGLSRIHRL
jgi:hypothetical protein